MNKQPSFLDPKTILAIILSAVVFYFWNSYLQNKYPQSRQQTEQIHAEANKQNVDKPEGKVDNSTAAVKKIHVNANNVKQDSESDFIVEAFTFFEDERIRLEFSNHGMGLKSIVLKTYKDRDLNIKTISKVNSPYSFGTNFVGRTKPLIFSITKADRFTYIGEADYKGAHIKKIVKIEPENYVLSTQLLITGNLEDIAGVNNFMTDKIVKSESSGILPASQFNAQQIYVNYGSEDDREILDEQEPLIKTYNRASVASIGEQYFAQAYVDNSKVLPDFKVNVLQEMHDDAVVNYVAGSIEYPVLDKAKNLNLSFKYFAGPKSLTSLQRVDANLQKLIDYGIFDFMARPLLYLLKWLQSFVSNWGVAIIILTIIVRIIILPLHVMSYKSMKNMQKVGPLIKELNVKYKDDPQAKSQAMMAIYKEHKINPMGGCLPMILQMPVFFALYQVIGQSIELYQAPFMYWVSDLSLSDPYYVLPVLMGVTMFFQMRLTPSTMDPTQAKIMTFMPLVFTLFMLSLPSGLTLYFLVSGVFAIIQQYVMRDRTTQTSTIPVAVKN